MTAHLLSPILRAFDSARVQADIAVLAHERFAGRRIGTLGHDQARDWLVARMQAFALHPVTFPFTLTTPVVEVYAPLVVEVAGTAMQRRHDFSEHPRSADVPTQRTGPVTPWREDASDWLAHWVRLDAVPRGPALTVVAEQVHQHGGLGLLVPQHPSEQGYLVKRVVMGEPVMLPVIAVRADLLPTLDDHLLSASASVRPHYAHGDLVIGELAGSDPELAHSPLILSAHYDGVGSDPGGPHFPCATDNAAGVAVLLELARLLHTSSLPLHRPVRFVLCDGEEVNAQGSLAYAQHLAAQGEVPLVLNLDGAARWHGHLSVELGTGAEGLIPALDAAGKALGIPLEQGMVSSDNRRFTGAGFPAVGISAGLFGMHTPADRGEEVQSEALLKTGHWLLHLIGELAT